MKVLLSAFFLAALCLPGVVFAAPVSTLAASQDAHLLSASGTVQIKSAAGRKMRPGHAGSSVSEGESVITGKDSTAVLSLFDGSQLTVSPDTDFRLVKSRKPSVRDKILQFKLFVGKLLAQVKKLASSQSSFEIEAGGVVCGVRGTKYSMAYDPDTGKVNVVVLDGTVWVGADGHTYTLGAGQQGRYDHGRWEGGGGGQAKGGNDFNPFYGFDGSAGDVFDNPLGDLAGDIDGVTDRVKTDGLLGLGPPAVILQLGFPEYTP
jgi:FecR protein